MIASSVEIKTPISPVTGKQPFRLLYNLPDDIFLLILIGGRGGMKSHEISKFIAKSATIDGKRAAILRDEQSKIKNSILNEIKLRYDTANQYGHLDKYFEKQENAIKNRKTGFDAVFTMGFRASSNGNTAGLKSVSDVDIALIEEAEDIRDVAKFNTFADGIRKQGYLIVIVLNTADLQHWITKRYFHATQITFDDVPELKGRVSESEIEGYFSLTTKSISGFACIQTSYKDNPYLPANKVAEYEMYGDPSSHTYNLHYYLTAIKGFSSSGRTGQILRKVKRISLKDYLALPYKEVYGQDFGTASPAGTIGCKFYQNRCYARQLNYLPKPVKELGKMYSQMKLTLADKIIADYAEPDTIAKLRNGWAAKELNADEPALYPLMLRGFFIQECTAKNIQAGISEMQSMELYAVEESTDLWGEINNYVYAVDKNKIATDEPVDDFNHLIDPWRYVIMDRKVNKGNIGTFAGAFR